MPPQSMMYFVSQSIGAAPKKASDDLRQFHEPCDSSLSTDPALIRASSHFLSPCPRRGRGAGGFMARPVGSETRRLSSGQRPAVKVFAGSVFRGLATGHRL